MNEVTTEDLVEVVKLHGEDWLFFRAFPFSVAFLRGTTADMEGNISIEREALMLEDLVLAMAAKNFRRLRNLPGRAHRPGRIAIVQKYQNSRDDGRLRCCR